MPVRRSERPTPRRTANRIYQGFISATAFTYIFGQARATTDELAEKLDGIVLK